MEPEFQPGNESEFLISQYLDGTLDAERRRTLARRIEQDPAMARLLEEYRALEQLTRQAAGGVPEVDWEVFAARIEEAIGRGACHPSVMGISPVPAVADLTERSGLQVGDFELVEVNEAFAAQYLGCEKALGLNREITNVNGSGIGLGHPVGATGARLIVTLLHALQKNGKTLGLATLCGGGGVSMATAIEMM